MSKNSRLINIILTNYHEKILSKLQKIYGLNRSDILRLGLIELYKSNKKLYKEKDKDLDQDLIDIYEDDKELFDTLDMLSNEKEF